MSTPNLDKMTAEELLNEFLRIHSYAESYGSHDDITKARELRVELLRRLAPAASIAICETTQPSGAARGYGLTGLNNIPASPLPAEPRQWLLWSNDHRAWWRNDGCGYTSVMADAGRFSLEKALNVCRANNYRAGSTLDEDCQPAEVMYPAPESPRNPFSVPTCPRCTGGDQPQKEASNG